MGRLVIDNIDVDDRLIRRFECKFMENSNGCWEWCSSKNYKGYGRMTIKFKNKFICPQAHRISYIIFNSPIPHGMTVHHICNNKWCVNPSHLTLLTEKENRELSGCYSSINKRKTHCIRGHKFTNENTYVYIKKDGSKHRHCIACRKLKNK